MMLLKQLNFMKLHFCEFKLNFLIVISNYIVLCLNFWEEYIEMM